MKTAAGRQSLRLRWTALGLAIASGAAALVLLDASRAQSDPSIGPAGQPRFAVPGDDTRSFADVIEQVSPAVVAIAVSKAAQPVPTGNLPPAPFGDFFGRFFDVPGAPPGMQPAPRRAQGQGSGFVIDSDGFIATNNHVVDGAEEITVILRSGDELAAEIVGVDPQTDIALLRVDSATPLPELAFGDSDSTRIGDWVLAIGNPFGLGGTATAGIVSARGRDIASGPYDDYLQIDAPINSGNSGGPVFNAAGEVIGINTAIISPNGGNIGIGLAIPSNLARHVLDDLLADGAVTRGWLGVQIQPVDGDLADALGMSGSDGALIAGIEPMSPASRSSLQTGDVVVRAGDERVASPRDLARIVGMQDAGDDLELEVIRDGRSRSITVELGTRDANERQASARGSRGGRTPEQSAARSLGLELRDLDAEARSRLGIEADLVGAVVTQVRPGSQAAAQGIRPGDVIVSVNRDATGTAEEALDALADAQVRGQRALVLVRRGNSQRFVALGAA